MTAKNNGHSEKLENGTCRKLSALLSILYSFLFILTGYFEAFELKENTIAVVSEVFGFIFNLK